MEAIILAGGFGTRLRPLTYSRAKSLLPIMNKPMISYLIDLLPEKVDTVILAVNYRKDQIEEYLSDLQLSKDIIVNDEPKPLGTGGAVKFAEDHITDKFFVLNSDIISSLDLSAMIRFHESMNAAATITLWPVDHVQEFGVAEVSDGDKIIGFVEKPKPEDAPSNLINAGAYILDPLVLDYIEPGRLVSMEKEIFPQIIQDTGRFYGFRIKDYWMDIGRIQSYLDVHQFFLSRNNMQNIIGEQCDIKGSIKRTVCGDQVHIGSDSVVDSCVILDHATIQEHCHLKDCIIDENSVIHPRCSLSRTVVGAHESVEENTRMDNQIIWTQPIPEGYPKKQIGNPIQT